ncbi:transglutaminase-like cysteine peptidase [Agaribacterium sp. ZY112]|uniref:transglutaminase-like cysteine peptidase n=1 Tax=Agaribacterium sp. ZY112 TaxID=3233574 RepID=UPI0035242273
MFGASPEKRQAQSADAGLKSAFQGLLEPQQHFYQYRRVYRLQKVKAVFLAILISAFSSWANSPAVKADFAYILNLPQVKSSPKVSNVHSWQDFLASTLQKTEIDSVRSVNHFFNDMLEFNADLAIWKQSDFWASPVDSLIVGQADCEDYAIGKYISLLAMGVEESKLRFVYVKATRPNGKAPQAHMVLAYYPSPSASPFILDNLNPTLLPASKRPDLRPVFSFNGDSLWLRAGSSSSESQSKNNLSLWRELLQRLQRQGITLI